MAEELTFKDEAAAEYDRAFAHVTAYLCLFCCVPHILRQASASLTGFQPSDFVMRNRGRLSGLPGLDPFGA